MQLRRLLAEAYRLLKSKRKTSDALTWSQVQPKVSVNSWKDFFSLLLHHIHGAIGGAHNAVQHSANEIGCVGEQDTKWV
jgi:hypothetical protein